MVLINRNITAFQLATATVITIQNAYYTDNYIKHVLTYAKYLRLLRIARTDNYGQQMIIKYDHLIHEDTRFEFGVETNPDNITLSLPNIEEMITPESVKRESQIKKKKLKMKYALLHSFELKHEIQYKLLCHINALFDLKN